MSLLSTTCPYHPVHVRWLDHCGPVGQSGGVTLLGPCGFRCWDPAPGQQTWSRSSVNSTWPEHSGFYGAVGFGSQAQFHLPCLSLSLCGVSVAWASRTHWALSAGTQSKRDLEVGAELLRKQHILLETRAPPHGLWSQGSVRQGWDQGEETQAHWGCLCPELLATGT